MDSLPPTPNAGAQRQTVLLVDDHPILLEGLARRINAEKDLTVCGEARSTTEALEAIEQHKPDVAVVDLALAGSHGLDLIKEMRTRHCQIPVLVFTMFDETIYAMRALKAGAQGYLSKDGPPEGILSGIRAVLKGEYAFSPRLSGAFLASCFQPSFKSPALEDSFGDREMQVFELMGKGASTRQIAKELERSIKTVETYQNRIKRKLQLKNSAELRREAVRWLESRLSNPQTIADPRQA